MIKLRYILLVGVVFFVLGGVVIYRYSQPQTLGQNSSVNTLSPWKVVSGTITPRTDTNDLAVPALVSCDTIDTDTNGVFSCGTDGGGAGGGSISGWATTTSQVSGELNLYTTLDTDILNVGGSATTTSFFWVDPNTSRVQVTGDTGTSTAVLGTSGNEWTVGTYGVGGAFRIASSTGLLDGATSALALTRAGLLTVANASTTYASATTFFGALTGNASTASALAANGGNCSAGQAPLGVNAAGAVESCFDVWTEAENTSAAYMPYSVWYATTSKANLATLAGLVTFGSSSATTTAAGNLKVTGALTVNGDYITDLTGTGLTLSGSTLALNATGDWTGTVDGNNFAGGAIGSGDMLYGSGAGSIAELALGASSTVLTNNGTAPRWMAPSGLCVAITGSADLCDGSDDGVGGSSEWTDAGSYVYPNEGDYAAAPYFVGTSTATSTFAGPVVFGGRTLQVGNPTEQAYVPSGGANSAFLILDKPNAASDASVLLGAAGDLKWEIGMAGDENLYWKKITGTESSGYTFENLFKMDYSTARIGIGTEAPSSKLEIASTSPSARVDMRITNKATSGTDGSSLQLVAENDGHVFYLGTDAGLNGGQNAFLNWGSFGTGLFINSSGNVAVQTTTIPTNTEFAVGGDANVTGTTTTAMLYVSTAFNFLGDYITNVSTWFLSKLQAVTSATLTGAWNFTGATVKQQHYKSFTWPGTATTTTATTTVSLGSAGTSQQWNWADCKVTSGTGGLQFKDDAGNKMEYKTLSTSYASTTVSTNNTFAGHEGRNVDVGPMTAAMVSCTVNYQDS